MNVDSKVKFADSHTHLTISPVKERLAEFLKSFSEKGGDAILNVGIDFESIYESIELKKRYRHDSNIKILNAIALHPESFINSHDFKQTFADFKSASKAMKELERIVDQNLDCIDAIGETGLDYHGFVHDDTIASEAKEELRQIQKHAFREHIKIAKNYDLPLSLHIRDNLGESASLEAAVAVLCEDGGGLKGCFHSYTGRIDLLPDLLNLGFYIGVNAIISYKNGETVRDIVRSVPINRILLETDAPLLPLESVRKNKKLEYRLGQPADIYEIGGIVAELKGLTAEEVHKQCRENFKSLFGV